MEELEASGLRGCLFRLDVRAGLGRLAQVEDRDEPHLLDFGNRERADGAAAGDGRFDVREVGDAVNLLDRDELWLRLLLLLGGWMRDERECQARCNQEKATSQSCHRC